MNGSGGHAGAAGDEREFAPKVDNWILAVLVGAAIMSVASALVSAGTDTRGAVISLLTIVAAFVLVLALAVPTHYTVGDSDLLIRSGVINRRIPLAAIERVYPTRNPLAAPAWSLDRLGVVYTRGQRRSLALIAPKSRAEFLALLAQRAGLEPAGKELRRPEA